MEKIRMLILYILILGVHILINVIPLSMASAHISLFFSYIFFIVLNSYLFIWQNSLLSSLSEQKGMYVCFAICACVTAIISWYPVYFKYIREENVGFYWIVFLFIFLCLICSACYALYIYVHYDARKKAKEDRWRFPIQSYRHNCECISNKNDNDGHLGTFGYESIDNRNKTTKKKPTLKFICVIWMIFYVSFYVIGGCAAVCFFYRFTHGVSYFQNLSNDYSTKAECAAKDFLSEEYGLYKAVAFAEPSKYYESYLTDITELREDDVWDVKVSYTRLRNGKTIDGEQILYVELKSNSAEVYYREDRESIWFLLFKEWPRRFNYELLKMLEKIVFPIIDLFVKE